MRVKAAIGDGKGDFQIDEIHVSDPGANELLIRIVASGVCHTDYDSMSWGKPLVLGHEGAGIVEKAGLGVDDYAEGDRVLLNWATPCGRCFQCLRGAENICRDPQQAAPERTTFCNHPIERAFRIGTLSTHTVVHQSAITKIDVEIPFTSACLIGCGVMTGYGSVVNAAKMEEKSTVAIIGTGGVGLNIIQGARLRKASKIIAIDIREERLAIAKTFGATHTIKADREDQGLLQVAEKVKAMTNSYGVDYAFESTAVPSLGAAPLAMCRDGGMAIQASGIEQEIAFDMTLFEWDKTYINPLYGQCRPAIDFPQILKHYQEGELKLDELVTRTYPLEDLGQAFEDMLSGINAKGVIVMEKA